MRLELVLGLLSLWLCLAAAVPSCIHETCTDCIQSPTCVWCKKENQSVACISENSGTFDVWRTQCGEANILNPKSDYVTTEDEALTSDSQEENIIIMRPQEVEATMRIKESINISLTYKNSRNHPADLYYLMDGSGSMKEDRKNLADLAEKLVEEITKITKNLRLGFGVFIDKPVLPYTSTADDEKPYSFKNYLPLTSNVTAFKEGVNNTEGHSNKDYIEGGFDGLMQVMVCDKKVSWRDLSLKLVVYSTDAGSHVAGDGLLAGIISPNDMECHLDNENSYSDSVFYDYPSVAQISQVAKEKRMNLIFAITEDQEPLYERLSYHVEGASVGVLAGDSSNVVDLLTQRISAIVKKVEMTQRGVNPLVSLRFFSTCQGQEMKERSYCEGLEFGDEVEFLVEVTVNECPVDEGERDTILEIHPVGRANSLEIKLKMECQCDCDIKGKPGYIEDAPFCNNTGDSRCGVCVCDEGFYGRNCECDKYDIDVSNNLCKQTNTSDPCSKQGNCACGNCECNQPGGNKRIWGKYCECTNFRGCGDENNVCSGHGNCDCNKCLCKDGWTGQLCDCSPSTDNCMEPESGEICSGHGSCECNSCKCDENYVGKFCEYCQTCPEECDKYTDCVECLAYGTGPLDASECRAQCQDYTITKEDDPRVSETNAGELMCAGINENKCSFRFVLAKNLNATSMRVTTDLNCPVNIIGVIAGVIGSILLIGILTLILWKVYATIQDRREYQKFILSRDDETWANNTNPLYKEATTTVQNPLFGAGE